MNGKGRPRQGRAYLALHHMGDIGQAALQGPTRFESTTTTVLRMQAISLNPFLVRVGIEI